MGNVNFNNSLLYPGIQIMGTGIDNKTDYLTGAIPNFLGYDILIEMLKDKTNKAVINTTEQYLKIYEKADVVLTYDLIRLLPQFLLYILSYDEKGHKFLNIIGLQRYFCIDDNVSVEYIRDNIVCYFYNELHNTLETFDGFFYNYMADKYVNTVIGKFFDNYLNLCSAIAWYVIQTKTNILKNVFFYDQIRLVAQEGPFSDLFDQIGIALLSKAEKKIEWSSKGLCHEYYSNNTRKQADNRFIGCRKGLRDYYSNLQVEKYLTLIKSNFYSVSNGQGKFFIFQSEKKQEVKQEVKQEMKQENCDAKAVINDKSAIKITTNCQIDQKSDEPKLFSCLVKTHYGYMPVYGRFGQSNNEITFDLKRICQFTGRGYGVYPYQKDSFQNEDFLFDECDFGTLGDYRFVPYRNCISPLTSKKSKEPAGEPNGKTHPYYFNTTCALPNILNCIYQPDYTLYYSKSANFLKGFVMMPNTCFGEPFSSNLSFFLDKLSMDNPYILKKNKKVFFAHRSGELKSLINAKLFDKIDASDMHTEAEPLKINDAESAGSIIDILFGDMHVPAKISAKSAIIEYNILSGNNFFRTTDNLPILGYASIEKYVQYEQNPVVFLNQKTVMSEILPNDLLDLNICENSSNKPLKEEVQTVLFNQSDTFESWKNVSDEMSRVLELFYDKKQQRVFFTEFERMADKFENILNANKSSEKDYSYNLSFYQCLKWKHKMGSGSSFYFDRSFDKSAGQNVLIVKKPARPPIRIGVLSFIPLKLKLDTGDIIAEESAIEAYFSNNKRHGGNDKPVISLTEKWVKCNDFIQLTRPTESKLDDFLYFFMDNEHAKWLSVNVNNFPYMHYYFTAVAANNDNRDIFYNVSQYPSNADAYLIAKKCMKYIYISKKEYYVEFVQIFATTIMHILHMPQDIRQQMKIFFKNLLKNMGNICDILDYIRIVVGLYYHQIVDDNNYGIFMMDNELYSALIADGVLNNLLGSNADYEIYNRPVYLSEYQFEYQHSTHLRNMGCQDPLNAVYLYYLLFLRYIHNNNYTYDEINLKNLIRTFMRNFVMIQNLKKNNVQDFYFIRMPSPIPFTFDSYQIIPHLMPYTADGKKIALNKAIKFYMNNIKLDKINDLKDDNLKQEVLELIKKQDYYEVNKNVFTQLEKADLLECLGYHFMFSSALAKDPRSPYVFMRDANTGNLAANRSYNINLLLRGAAEVTPIMNYVKYDDEKIVKDMKFFYELYPAFYRTISFDPNQPYVEEEEEKQGGGHNGGDTFLRYCIIILIVILFIFIHNVNKLLYANKYIQNGQYVYAAPRFRANCASPR